MIEVKQVFAQKYPEFSQKHPLLAFILIKFIAWLWQEKTMQRFASMNEQVYGADFVSKGFEFLQFHIHVCDQDLAKIPTEGPLIVVANHSIGLDGVGLLRLVAKVRPDAKVVANALLYNVKQMQPVIIPTDNLGKGASKRSILMIDEHLKAGGALVLFPAGSVAREYNGVIEEGRWNHAFVKLAHKYGASIVPVSFTGRNSRFFYWLSRRSFALSTLFLIREVYKFTGKSISAKVAEPITPDELLSLGSVSEQVVAIRQQVITNVG